MSPKPRERSKTTHSQSQSALFRLPLELRLRIFRFAISSSPVPLSVVGPRKELELVLSTPGIGGEAVKAWRAARPFSLLLTCSWTHDEALPLLYANTLAIGDPRAVQLLAASPNADLIQNLDFSWTMSRAPAMKPKKRLGGLLGSRKDEWTETWEGMKKLKGLKWLRIEISVPWLWTPEWREREHDLFTPLQGLLPSGATGELFLSWPRTGEGKRAEELLPNWTIQRKEGEEF